MNLKPLALFLIALLLIPLAGAVAPTFTELDQSAFLTSTHTAGLIFYSSRVTNTSDSWANPFRVADDFSVSLIGDNLSFQINLLDSGESWNGTTDSALSKWTFTKSSLNRSSVWLFIKLGNTTLNFGTLSLDRAPILIIEPDRALQVTLAQMSEAIKDALWWAVLVAMAGLWVAYNLIVRWKRGRVVVY